METDNDSDDVAQETTPNETLDENQDDDSNVQADDNTAGTTDVESNDSTNEATPEPADEGSEEDISSDSISGNNTSQTPKSNSQKVSTDNLRNNTITTQDANEGEGTREDWLHYSIDLVWDIGNENQKYDQKVIANSENENLHPKYKFTIQTSSVDYAPGMMEFTLPLSIFTKRQNNAGRTGDTVVADPPKVFATEFSILDDPNPVEGSYFYYIADYDNDVLKIINNKTVYAGSNQVIEVAFDIDPDDIVDLDKGKIQAHGHCKPTSQNPDEVTFDYEDKDSPEITYQLDTGLSSISEYSEDRKFEQLYIKDGYRYYNVEIKSSVYGNQSFVKEYEFDFLGTDGEIVGPEENVELNKTMTLEEAAEYYKAYSYYIPQGGSEASSSHRLHSGGYYTEDDKTYNDDLTLKMIVRYPDSDEIEEDKLKVNIKFTGGDEDSHTPPEDYNDILSTSVNFSNTWEKYPDKPIGDLYKNPRGQSRNRGEIFDINRTTTNTIDHGAAYWRFGYGNPSVVGRGNDDNNKVVITDTGIEPENDAPEFDNEFTSVFISIIKNGVKIYNPTTQTISNYDGNDWFENVLLEGSGDDGEWQEVFSGSAEEYLQATSYRKGGGTLSGSVESPSVFAQWNGKGYQHFRITFTGVKENIVFDDVVVEMYMHSLERTAEFVNRQELDQYRNWAQIDLYDSSDTHLMTAKDWGMLTLTPFEEKGSSSLQKSVHKEESDTANREVVETFNVNGMYQYSLGTKRFLTTDNGLISSAQEIKKLFDAVPELREGRNSLYDLQDLVYYDLLPPGYRFDSVTTDTAWNRLMVNGEDHTGVYPSAKVIEDFRGTGRQLVIFTVDTDTYFNRHKNNGEELLWLYSVFQYTARIAWEDLVYYQNEYNLVALQGENPIEVYDGLPDDGNPNSTSVNQLPFTYAKDNDDEYAYKDINEDGDTTSNNTLYANVIVSPNVVTGAISGIQKHIMGDSGKWTELDHTDINKRYHYRVRISADSSKGSISDLIIYDTLEDAANTDQFSGEVTWKGYFHSVDVSWLERHGYAPVVYYSTADVSELDYNLVTGRENNPWIDDTSLWSTEIPSDPKSVTAVAVDCRKLANGDDATVLPEQGVEFVINMDAPEEYPTLKNPDMVYAINRAAYMCKLTGNYSAEGDYFTDIGHRVKIYLEPYGKLTVKKISENEETPSWTRFKVEGPNGYEKSFYYSELVANDGFIEIEDLNLGTYTISEINSDSDSSKWTVTFDGAANPTHTQEGNTNTNSAEVELSFEEHDKTVTITNTSANKRVEGDKTWREREDLNEIYGLNFYDLPDSRRNFSILLYANEVLNNVYNMNGVYSTGWSAGSLPSKDDDGEDIVYDFDEMIMLGMVSPFGSYGPEEYYGEYSDDGSTVTYTSKQTDILSKQDNITLTLVEFHYDSDSRRQVFSLVETKEVSGSTFIEDGNILFEDLTAIETTETGDVYHNYYIYASPEAFGYAAIKDGMDLTNVRLMDVTATKTWEAPEGADTPEVTLKLYKTVNGEKTEVEGQSKKIPANAKDDELTVTWKNLPEYEGEYPVTYTVEEGDSDEYELVKTEGDDIKGFTLTNKPLTEVSGTKTWDDADDQDGIRPTEITVNLMNGDTKVNSATVTEDEEGNWTYSFAGLDKYDDNGEEIKYTVEEETVEGYTTTIDDYDITNKHVPETIDIDVIKTWDDSDDQDGVRPTKITVKLMNGSEVVDTVTITEADGWKYTFEGLPKYSDGKEISYTVEEEPVEGYTTTIDEFDITNSYTPETTSVSGTKTWDDLEDQDAKRPTSITVNLLADGSKVDSKSISASDDWKFAFDNLPAKKDGKEIVYTIEEEVVEYYMTELSGDADTGYSILNIHRPWTPRVPGTPGEVGKFSIRKTVSGVAETDKAFDIYIRFTHEDGDSYIEKLSLKSTDEPVVFDKVQAGDKIQIIESVEGYDMTCYVDGEVMTEFNIEAGDDIEVVVNNHKDKPKIPDEPEKPTTPTKPTKPSTPTKETPKTAVKTGDETDITLWLWLLAGAAVLTVGLKRKKS